MKLSKHLQDMLQYLPKDKWFVADDLPLTKVPRTEWVLKQFE